MAWTTSTWSPSFSSVLSCWLRGTISRFSSCHPAPGQVQAGQQGRNAFAVGQFVRFTVQLNAHAHGHHCFWGSILAPISPATQGRSRH
jgi:hypothetical protein